MSIKKKNNLDLNYKTSESLLKHSKILSNSYLPEESYPPYNNHINHGKIYANNQTNDNFLYPNSYFTKSEEKNYYDSPIPNYHNYSFDFKKPLENYDINHEHSYINKSNSGIVFTKNNFKEDSLFFKEEFENNSNIKTEVDYLIKKQKKINLALSLFAIFIFYGILLAFSKYFAHREKKEEPFNLIILSLLPLLLLIRSLHFTCDFFKFIILF